jgi:predicted dithiol-disulfide oxidoreductase (DUF899 family)
MERQHALERKGAGGCVAACARGIDMIDETYNLLDPVPKRRDETNLSFTMERVRGRDECKSRTNGRE